MKEAQEQSSGSRPRSTWWIAVPGILLLLLLVVAVVVWRMRPHLTDRDVDGLVTAAIQQEAKAAFLVTGYMDINAQARVANTLRLLPGLLNLSMGSTTTNVRAPGRVHYGFNVSEITPDRIRLEEDGVIEVVVPQPEVYTVSPDLDRLEIETSVGWTRMGDDSRREVETRALALVQENMRLQAENHLRTSQQPGVNSADALYALLRPVLIAAGMKNPRFRFRIGRDLVMEPRDR